MIYLIFQSGANRAEIDKAFWHNPNEVILSKLAQLDRKGWHNLNRYIHFLLRSCFWEKEDRFIELKLEFTRKLNIFPGIGYQASYFKIGMVFIS